MTLMMSLKISASFLSSTKQSSVLFSVLGKTKRLDKYVAFLLQLLFKFTSFSMEAKAGETSFCEDRVYVFISFK